MATVEIVQTNGYDKRKLVCPFGCEYSATPGDYFWKSKDKPFLCEHDGEQYPCALVERAYVSGTTDDGKEYCGTAWVTIVEEATLNDL